MQIKIASFNINSIRLRLPLLTKLLKKHQFDVICVQETKVIDELFPLQEIQSLGYPYVSFKGEKSYNGVCIISKLPFIREDSFNMVSKGDKRHVLVELENGLTIHNFYIPAGGDIPDVELNPKFAHKLAFVDEMAEIFHEPQTRSVILGDFNIAPFEHDVWSHKQLLDVVSHTEIEVSKLLYMRDKGSWLDAHRHFISQDKKLYSWWSYRARDWQKSNRGRRLDHIWLSPDLKDNLLAANIDKDSRGYEKPSDHAVIDVVINL